MLNISVIVNTVAVIFGSMLGLLGGKFVKERYRKVFFNVSICYREICFRLIVVVVGYKIFHRTLRKKLFELPI